MDALPESTTPVAETTVDEDEEVMSLFELIMGNIDALDDFEFESEKLVVTEEAAAEEADDSRATTTTTGSSD